MTETVSPLKYIIKLRLGYDDNQHSTHKCRREKKNTFIITQQLSFSAHFVVLFSKV